ncbi:DUF72 domain-containing protein [Skermania sp. ID1734]|uniref:DUF72 domain-containing protein n=1 Tax=Skermania sp. ID1734 TaxID=2597516 RepID=UPI00117C6C2A|nr:DUF72 domain-containing protein [Skermania sp. ID1734]TSE00721.1 DUF72 domain-containing protein [Skermania sp. ID1734]
MICVGTSGWVYPPWRGTFYPAGLPHRRELEYLSRTLNSVEINGSFYSLQRPSSYLSWAQQTPPDFVFAVKGSRFITHMKRLADVEEPLATFFASGMLALGPKLGPFLWQLPPTMQFEPARLERFFDLLPRTTTAAAELARGHSDRITGRAWTETDAERPLRHAVEVRHHSFDTGELEPLLRRHDVALVLADSAGKFPAIDLVTSDFTYARLHGDVELYTSGYTDEALDRWAARLRTHAERRDVFVYFDNDVKVRAPVDARGLLERISSPTSAGSPPRAPR